MKIQGSRNFRKKKLEISNHAQYDNVFLRKTCSHLSFLRYAQQKIFFQQMLLIMYLLEFNI